MGVVKGIMVRKSFTRRLGTASVLLSHLVDLLEILNCSPLDPEICHLSGQKTPFLSKRATLPSAFSGWVFSHNLVLTQPR